MTFQRTRDRGLNPRALGTNERALARNKWALRTWKRKQRKLDKRLREDSGFPERDR